MQQNFTFIGEDVADWHIDEKTKAIGKKGIATARQILNACRHDDHKIPTAA